MAGKTTKAKTTKARATKAKTTKAKTTKARATPARATPAKPTVNQVVKDVVKRRKQARQARERALAKIPAPAAARSSRTASKRTAHVAIAGKARTTGMLTSGGPSLFDYPGSKSTLNIPLAMAAKARTKGWLIAEGDSWFDYPGSDLLDALEESAYNVQSVARAGDRVEMMAFGRGQLEKFAAAIDKVKDNEHTPRAVLLSGGGNDIAGSEFGFLINHAGSPRQGFNDSIVRGVIDERARDSYVWIIRTITALCQEMVKRKVRIIVHGYGYPIPDGDAVLGGWPLPGPWLRPGFIEKGFNDLAQNTQMMRSLMDRFNNMLKGVANQFPHVRYVDLRHVLPAAKALWANELHPKEKGFRLAAKEFEKAIEAP